MRRSDTPPAVGGSSLLVIFIVLCLTVFALLSLSSVQADGRLSTASAEAVRAYYAADCEAEGILAKLRQGKMPEGVIKQGDSYKYECEISEVQKLVVEAEVSGEEYRILRWQAVSTTEWKEEDTLNLWDGAEE